LECELEGSALAVANAGALPEIQVVPQDDAKLVAVNIASGTDFVDRLPGIP
jgi:hypothetical protein